MKTAAVLVLVLHQPPAGAAKWQSHDLIKTEQVSVRLLVRPEADMLQTGWIKLEFDNRTGQPLSAFYNFSVRLPAPPAEGGPADPAPRYVQFTDMDFRTIPRDQPDPNQGLPPGRTMVGEELLAPALGIVLQLPPEAGRSVDARAQMRVSVSSTELGFNSRLTTPADGIEFTFNWRRPKPEQLAAARKELTGLLLTDPIVKTEAYRQRLRLLLSLPELHAELPTHKVLAALMRFSINDYRMELYRALVVPRRNEPKVIDFYLGRIKAGDEWACYELLHGDYRPIPGQRRSEELYVWDKSITDATVTLLERDWNKNRMALAALTRRAKEWSDDPKVTARLAAVVRKVYPVMDTKLEGLDKEQVKQLMYGIFYLGQTRDRASLPWLRRAMALDYKSPVPRPVDFLRPYPSADSVAHQAAVAVVEILEDGSGLWRWLQQRGKRSASAEDVIAYAKERLARWEAEKKMPK